MNIEKIKTQWYINLLIFTISLITLNIIFIIYRKQHYYNHAQQNLNFSATTIDFKIESLENNDLIFLNHEIKKIIRNFESDSGTIVIGFNMDEKAIVASNKNLCTTYENLLKTINQKKIDSKKIFYCNLTTGEHVMIKIKPISSTNCEFSKIMYVLSLKKVDNLIFKTKIACFALSLLIIVCVFFAGKFFIKKLLKPIIEINKITKKITNGQKNLKIKKNFNSELKDLCNSINFLSKKLHNSEYAQNEFISSISHELRTPLTAIKGWSETILNSNSDKQMLFKGISIISKEVTRLAIMVDELLDFSKIKNGHLKLFKEKMDPFAELQETILIYNDIAKKQNKTIIYKEQAVVPTIFGDKNRIKQVFMNIIDNALKYSDTNAIIKVEAIVNEKTADIIIEDNGKGIAKQHLKHITEKFFRVNNLNKIGSGIGLAVVKEIVQKHSGILNFKSKPNKGTTVKISFPIFK